MDWETPIDGWYVWLGVAVVSVALTGFALGIPSQPPPDATKAANTIDRVASSTQQASASYEHDADEVRIDTKQVMLRNEGGTAQASVAFGSLLPVDAVIHDGKREALTRILHGRQPSAVLREYSFDAVTLLDSVTRTRKRIDRRGSQWRSAEGVLSVRRVRIAGEAVTLLEA